MGITEELKTSIISPERTVRYLVVFGISELHPIVFVIINGAVLEAIAFRITIDQDPNVASIGNLVVQEGVAVGIPKANSRILNIITDIAGDTVPGAANPDPLHLVVTAVVPVYHTAAPCADPPSIVDKGIVEDISVSHGHGYLGVVGDGGVCEPAVLVASQDHPVSVPGCENSLDLTALRIHLDSSIPFFRPAPCDVELGYEDPGGVHSHHIPLPAPVDDGIFWGTPNQLQGLLDGDCLVVGSWGDDDAVPFPGIVNGVLDLRVLYPTGIINGKCLSLTHLASCQNEHQHSHRHKGKKEDSLIQGRSSDVRLWFRFFLLVRQLSVYNESC